MTDLSEQISNYISEHSTPEDTVLAELYRETHLKMIYPRMISGPLQGKFLELISRMIRPKYILEIGTFTGYSAICLAKGLANNGKLYTIEINDELTGFSKKYFSKAGLSSKIELITGNAIQIIPTLPYSFDLVFIDAEKKEYVNYYNAVIEKLVSGGIIIIDNVLWDNKVIEKPKQSDQETLAIKELNDLIVHDSRVENIILPLRDGINLIRKK